MNISQTDYILAPIDDPIFYEVFYFLDEAAANGQLISDFALTSAQVANFTTPGTEPVEVFVLIRDDNCFNVRSFLVQIGNPSGEFSYPPDTDGTPDTYCFNSTSALVPILDELTSGGAYTIAPATGLIIDEETGTLNLMGATPGTYEITYLIPEGPAPTIITSYIINPSVLKSYNYIILD